MRKLKGKNVLITGGAGFIGSHLVDGVLAAEAGKVVIVDNFFVGKIENLKESKDEIIVYKENAADLYAMEMICKKEEIHIVYNMATMALIYSFFNPHTAYMINVTIADTLIHLLRNGAYETLIHMSSSEAYGTALYAPMDENHPLNPTTPYAAGKAAADLLVKSICNIMSLDVVIIRPFNNYGPRQSMDGPLAGIIPLTVKRIKDGEKPFIEGDGQQTRDYIYVTDTVCGLIAVYENENIRGEIINLGSGVEYKIEYIVKEICKHYNYTGEIEYRKERIADVRRLCASSEKAKKLLGIKPRVDFSNGIKKTLNWYNERISERSTE